jgi:hypothetical protein
MYLKELNEASLCKMWLENFRLLHLALHKNPSLPPRGKRVAVILRENSTLITSIKNSLSDDFIH